MIRKESFEKLDDLSKLYFATATEANQLWPDVVAEAKTLADKGAELERQGYLSASALAGTMYAPLFASPFIYASIKVAMNKNNLYNPKRLERWLTDHGLRAEYAITMIAAYKACELIIKQQDIKLFAVTSNLSCELKSKYVLSVLLGEINGTVRAVFERTSVGQVTLFVRCTAKNAVYALMFCDCRAITFSLVNNKYYFEDGVSSEIQRAAKLALSNLAFSCMCETPTVVGQHDTLLHTGELEFSTEHAKNDRNAEQALTREYLDKPPTVETNASDDEFYAAINALPRERRYRQLEDGTLEISAHNRTYDNEAIEGFLARCNEKGFNRAQGVYILHRGLMFRNDLTWYAAYMVDKNYIKLQYRPQRKDDSKKKKSGVKKSKSKSKTTKRSQRPQIESITTTAQVQQNEVA